MAFHSDRPPKSQTQEEENMAAVVVCIFNLRPGTFALKPTLKYVLYRSNSNISKIPLSGRDWETKINQQTEREGVLFEPALISSL